MTSLTRARGWLKSSSSGRNVYAVRTNSPSASHPAPAKGSALTSGPPTEFGK